MKKLFIPAKSDVKIEPLLKKVKLKGKIGVLTTVQHLDEVKKIKDKRFVIGGQILGCNASNAMKLKVDYLLYIGSGRFHPIQIALETNKEVYILNPFTKEFSKLEKKNVDRIKKKIKGAYLKYLNAKKVGVIVSTKPGQNKKFDIKTDKEIYYFMCDNVTNQIENFPDIDIWINTACPRLAYENEFNVSMINIDDLKAAENL
ncbi:MAG: diphthamide synthesis protein [archaeon]